MKIRTVDDLFDRISADQAWRKKEVSVFAAHADAQEGAVQKAMLRPLVAILYAHWEGFVRNVVYYYILYVSSQKLALGQLRVELAATCLRSSIRAAGPASRIGPHIEVVRAVREGADAPAQFPIGLREVETKANLSSKVLEDLLLSIGCDPGPYSEFADLIDQQLVDKRNRIAHGEDHYIELSEWSDLHSSVFSIMDSIAVQVIDAALARDYLKPSP